MKYPLLLLSIVLIHTANGQRRGPWRGMRPPPRRLPPCIEERLQSITTNIPSYRATELVANRPTEPLAPVRTAEPIPCKKIETPSTLEAIVQIAHNIPKPELPTADYYQNVLLSPNLFGMVSNQMVQTEPRYQVPNKQYFQNLVVPKPRERDFAIEVPRTERILVKAIEPEKPCPCSPPSSINPFLSAASPISPWMANLPTTSGQARSHLRKIPIPPPSL